MVHQHNPTLMPVDLTGGNLFSVIKIFPVNCLVDRCVFHVVIVSFHGTVDE